MQLITEAQVLHGAQQQRQSHAAQTACDSNQDGCCAKSGQAAKAFSDHKVLRYSCGRKTQSCVARAATGARIEQHYTDNLWRRRDA
jgi:hypothetical protein